MITTPILHAWTIPKFTWACTYPCLLTVQSLSYLGSSTTNIHRVYKKCREAAVNSSQIFGFWFCFCSSLIRVPQQNFLVGCWGQNISNVEGREENSLAVWLWWTEVDCGGAVNKNCSSSLNFDSSKVKKFAAALHKERIFFYVYFAVQYWTCLGPNLWLDWSTEQSQIIDCSSSSISKFRWRF